MEARNYTLADREGFDALRKAQDSTEAIRKRQAATHDCWLFGWNDTAPSERESEQPQGCLTSGYDGAPSWIDENGYERLHGGERHGFP